MACAQLSPGLSTYPRSAAQCGDYGMEEILAKPTQRSGTGREEQRAKAPPSRRAARLTSGGCSDFLFDASHRGNAADRARWSETRRPEPVGRQLRSDPVVNGRQALGLTGPRQRCSVEKSNRSPRETDSPSPVKACLTTG
jgi:hypothetical protein